jgi:hypothetical protein
MIKHEHDKLTLECLLEKIRYVKESRDVLAELNPETARDLKCTSLHAVYLIQNLFSDESSNQANINRITLNLEAAAADLLSFSRQIRGLSK